MDSKNIKDYLHLYLGCDVILCEPEGTPITVNLRGLTRERTDHEDMIRIQVYESDGDDGYEGRGMIWCDEDEIELILRPLSDMTEDEFRIVVGWPVEANREVIIFYTTDTFICCEYRWPFAEIAGGFGYSSTAMYFSKIEWEPSQFIYLLSRSFDLFGLIDAGLAIKKSQ